MAGRLPYTFRCIQVGTGSGTGDYNGGLFVLLSVQLPDEAGTYSFEYDQGPYDTVKKVGHYGQMTSITLPTEGVTNFTYSAPPSGGTNVYIAGGPVASISDNAGTTSISYSANASAPYSGVTGYFYPVTVTFPSHVTTPGGSGTIQDATLHSASNYTLIKQEYSGSATSGTLLRTTTTTTNSAFQPTKVVTQWKATSESHEVDIQYDSFNQYVSFNWPTQVKEYDSGSLVRTVNTTYLTDTASNKYVSVYNMINYPSSVTLLDQKGNVFSQVQYSYDEYSATYCNVAPPGLSSPGMLSNITGAADHDDSGHGLAFQVRGNVTTSKYSGAGMSSITKHFCYDTLGNVTESIDGNGNPTATSYVDNYFESDCLDGNLPTYALPTKVTNALGQTTATSYYSCGYNARQVTGPNDIANSRSGTIYAYDILSRPYTVSKPDGGQTGYSYPSSQEVDVTTLTGPSGNPGSDTIQTLLDSYGRTTSQIDDGSGAEVDTAYDAFGRVASVSNAHYAQSAASDGLTYFAYDPFGRKIAQTNPDKSTESWVYSGNTFTFTNVLGHQWQQTSDSLGRLTKVIEPAVTGTSPTIETDYSSYDVLNNLITAVQKGNGTESAVTRNFTYDGASRLLSSSNPEMGSVTYSYDANGNLKSKTSPLVNASSGTQSTYYDLAPAKRIP